LQKAYSQRNKIEQLEKLGLQKVEFFLSFEKNYIILMIFF